VGEVAGVGSSVGTGSTHPASPFGGVPVFPRAPGDRDRRPDLRPSFEPPRLDRVPPTARVRLPSRAPLQGGRRFGARHTHLAARAPSSPLLDFGPLQRLCHGGSGNVSPCGPGASFAALFKAARPTPREASSLATFRPRRFLGCRSRELHLRRPRRFAPRRACRAASRRPGALLRFRLQGLVPPRGSTPLSRRPALLRVLPAGFAAKRRPRAPASELRSPQGIRAPAGRNPSGADALVTFTLQGSLPSRAAPGFPGAAPVRFSGRSCDRPPALRSFSPSRVGCLLVAEAPAFLGFPTFS
jgi:hypothetical protein